METDPEAFYALIEALGNGLPIGIERERSTQTPSEGVSTGVRTFALASLIGASVPIRLTQTPTICRVLPLSRVKFSESRRLDVARDTKKRAEGVERAEPPVEAECELVEVGL